MRRFTLILLLLGMLLVVGIIEAQEENSIEEVVNNIIYYSIALDKEIYSQDMIHAISENLESHGITVSFVSIEARSEIPDDGILYIFFLPHYSHLDNSFLNMQMELYVESNHLSSVSPMLLENIYFSFDATSGTNDLVSALVLYSIGQFDDAESHLLTVYGNFEHNGQARAIVDYYLGNIMLIQGDLEQAQFYYERIQPNQLHYCTFYWTNLIWLNISEGELESSIEALTNIIWTRLHECGFNPIYISYLYATRARLYGLDFEYDSAIADMDEAINLAEENEADNTTLAELYTIRGQIIFLIYEWDRVLENFNHAVALDPTYAPAYFQRGVLYYTMTQRENALVDFQHYLELEPDGLYAEEAAQYIESIQNELESLGS
jgi:tetratricopeptide (TPR) repeat protein